MNVIMEEDKREVWKRKAINVRFNEFKNQYTSQIVECECSQLKARGSPLKSDISKSYIRHP